MPTASALRLQIETTLAKKIPSALSQQPKTIRPVVPTGIEGLDDLLRGGLPVGAFSELTGPECSGRTSVALSLVARNTEVNKVCAWIDVSNVLDPASAAAVGVNLKKLLWVRCGVREAEAVRTKQRFVLSNRYFVPRPIKKGLHGGGFGPHPRTEVRGLSDAVGDLFHQELTEPHCAEPQHRLQPAKNNSAPSFTSTARPQRFLHRAKQFDAIEQGLRSADLVLQTGGFSVIVLDLASIAPEFVARIELSTWHRYRVDAERTQSSILLLTQYPCAKSSSELQLRLFPAEQIGNDMTVFTGMRPRVEVVRQRFTQTASNIVPHRKPPQNVHTASWHIPTAWAVRR